MAIIQTNGLGRDFVVRKGSGLRRTATTVTALDHLDLTVEAGESVGYIGANGAGKSTTIKMLAGILVPTRGTVRVCGFDPVPQRRDLARQIGVVFGQRSQLWWDLPLKESYPILAAMHRMPEATWRPGFEELVDELELGEFLETPVRQLSLGQRMRGEIAAALLHSPRLVILDEPTIGLDMVSKERLRQFLLHEMAARGTSLLLTTHDMSDVSRLCRRIVVIDHGAMAFDGTATELAAASGAERRLVVDMAEPVDLILPEGARIADTQAGGLRVTIAFAPERLTAATVVSAVTNQAEVIDLSVAEPDIEDLVRDIYQRGRTS